jgi:hypothetical protein
MGLIMAKRKPRKPVRPRYPSWRDIAEPWLVHILGWSPFATVDQARLQGWSPSASVDPQVLLPEGEGQPPVATPARPPVGPDPLLTATLKLIPRSPRLQRLITFLYRRPTWAAGTEEASRDVYGTTDKSSLANTRLLVRRNAPILDQRDAPLRLFLDKPTDQIKLLPGGGATTT